MNRASKARGYTFKRAPRWRNVSPASAGCEMRMRGPARQEGSGTKAPRRRCRIPQTPCSILPRAAGEILRDGALAGTRSSRSGREKGAASSGRPERFPPRIVTTSAKRPILEASALRALRKKKTKTKERQLKQNLRAKEAGKLGDRHPSSRRNERTNAPEKK